VSTRTDVRRARPGDEEKILLFWRQLVDEQEKLDDRLRYSADAVRRWRKDLDVWIRGGGERRIWVAADSHELTGFVSAEPLYSSVMFEERLDVLVTEIFVTQAHRDRGIGRRLVEAVKTWAVETGASGLAANVLSSNAAGRAFWRRVGASSFYETVTLTIERPRTTAQPTVRFGF
jgi:GNAT superfamily N-acetyltransferase